MRVGLAQKECDHSAWARPCFELWAAYGPRFATFQVIAHGVRELSRRTFSNHRRGEFLRPVLCSCWYLSFYYGRAKRTGHKIRTRESAGLPDDGHSSRFSGGFPGGMVDSSKNRFQIRESRCPRHKRDVTFPPPDLPTKDRTKSPGLVSIRLTVTFIESTSRRREVHP